MRVPIVLESGGMQVRQWLKVLKQFFRAVKITLFQKQVNNFIARIGKVLDERDRRINIANF